jgi:hypothetical protein
LIRSFELNMEALLRPLLFALAALCALTSTASADTGQTAEATFYPLFMRGQLVGCQVAFSVIRQDDEFNSGNLTRANGLIVAYGPRADRMGAMLRLGVLSSSGRTFQPPERAFLLNGFRTNATETGDSFISDTPGFRVIPYALGETTVAAIFGLAENGLLELTYGMPGTSVDARVRVDLRDHPDVLQQWGECLLEALRE